MIGRQDLLVANVRAHQLRLGCSGEGQVIDPAESMLPGDAPHGVVGEKISPFYSTPGGKVTKEQKSIPDDQESQERYYQEAGQSGEESSHALSLYRRTSLHKGGRGRICVCIGGMKVI